MTFAAQNPMLTYYYHTWRDMPERFEMETVGDGFDVILGVIDKIAASRKRTATTALRKNKNAHENTPRLQPWGDFLYR